MCSYGLLFYCEMCVLLSGTPNSDVKCEPCPLGTFSNKSSYTEPCRPVSETTTIITTSTATEKSHLIVPDIVTSSPTEGVITSTVESSPSLGKHNGDYGTITFIKLFHTIICSPHVYWCLWAVSVSLLVVLIPCVLGLVGFLILVVILFCLYKKFCRKGKIFL